MAALIRVRSVRPAFPSCFSQSEKDWAQVMQRLEGCEKEADMVGWLAKKRSDKPDPLKYAERTVYKAARRLQGVIETPVTER
jgi:hypothetical protein